MENHKENKTLKNQEENNLQEFFNGENQEETIENPIWLSVSEAAKIGGVTTKTIRRALQDKKLKYKIIKNRYLIELLSVVIFLNRNKKLKNKLNQYGIGQYLKKWPK